MKHFIYLLLFVTCLAGCNNNNKQSSSEIKMKKERSAEFKNTDPKGIPGNIIKMMVEEWMLITAGDKESYNTMTAGWGGLGNLWERPVATCYIDPSRHTFGFMEKGEYYTLCFFDEQYRDALRITGTTSGRDYKDKNKAEEAGLTPAYTKNGAVYFKEAYLVIECKKLYAEHFKKECFTTDVVIEVGEGHKVTYNELDAYHKMFIGEITDCLMR